MILALVNNKGGVGKTTTAVNLTAALASPKRQVLLVDLDAQASASLSLGVTRDQNWTPRQQPSSWRVSRRPLRSGIQAWRASRFCPAQWNWRTPISS